MRNVEYRDSLAETFRYAYKDVKMDIAIVSAEEALGFVLQYRDKILPGVPIVFYSLSAIELMTLGNYAAVRCYGQDGKCRSAAYDRSSITASP